MTLFAALCTIQYQWVRRRSVWWCISAYRDAYRDIITMGMRALSLRFARMSTYIHACKHRRVIQRKYLANDESRFQTTFYHRAVLTARSNGWTATYTLLVSRLSTRTIICYDYLECVRPNAPRKLISSRFFGFNPWLLPGFKPVEIK